MIDYETYCRIKDALQRQKLNYTQAAQALGLHPQTVAAWAERPWGPRVTRPRASVLFNPRYLDFARHYGFEITACNLHAGHENGSC